MATDNFAVTVVPVLRDVAGRSPAVAAPADAVPVAQRAVKPVGRPTYKIAAGASVAGPRTVHNTLAGRTNTCRNFLEFRLRAGPRAAQDILQEPPWAPLSLTDGAPDVADIEPAGTLSHAPSVDSSEPHATDASDGPALDSARYSNDFAVAPAQTSSGIPSTGTAGSLEGDRRPRAMARGLDRLHHPTESKVGPRVRITPNGSSLGKELMTPSRDAFYSLTLRRSHAAAALLDPSQSTMTDAAARVCRHPETVPPPLSTTRGLAPLAPSNHRETGIAPDRC